MKFFAVLLGIFLVLLRTESVPVPITVEMDDNQLLNNNTITNSTIIFNFIIGISGEAQNISAPIKLPPGPQSPELPDETTTSAPETTNHPTAPTVDISSLGPEITTILEDSTVSNPTDTTSFLITFPWRKK